VKLAQALRQGTVALRDIDGGARDARVLLAGALGVDASRITLMADDDVTPGDVTRYQAMLARRTAGEPVARILGQRRFWGQVFKVTPDVLDPRPETETLIAEALQGPVPTRFLDLGTGSGIIALTLLGEWPGAQGVATDISQAALNVARTNAHDLGVSRRLDLIQSDWYACVSGTFDLIVSNPPYIGADEMAGLSREVREWDPEIALTPGGDGLSPYRVIADGAPKYLCPGGRLMVEIGPTQGQAVAQMFRDAGLQGVALLADLDGRDRVVTGRKA